MRKSVFVGGDFGGRQYQRAQAIGSVGGFLDDLIANASANVQAALKQTGASALQQVATQAANDPNVQKYVQTQAQNAAISATSQKINSAASWISQHKWILLGGGVGVLALTIILLKRR